MSASPARRVLSILLVLSCLLSTLPGVAVAQAPDAPDSPPLYLPFVSIDGSPDTPPPTPEPEPNAPSVRTLPSGDEGEWPQQVAASTGEVSPSIHGPQRNDPAEGIPTHAYSPFDERNNREHPCPPGGCDIAADTVLVKLTSDAAAAQRSGVQSAAADDAFVAAGVVALEPVFPNAEPPIAGATVTDPEGIVRELPDLSAWYQATLAETSAASVTEESVAIASAVETLMASPNVEWAEPVYIRKPVGESIDAAQQGAPDNSGTVGAAESFNDPLYAQQWHHSAANVPAAWDWLANEGLPPGGNRDIVVAVIDTGIDLTHPDLAANLWVNAPEFNGIAGVDDDSNGYVDDKYGVNTTTNSGNPADDHGHGTHVAGIIAAQANNGVGGVGVAYNVQVMAIKAAQYSGVLTSDDIAQGIIYAVQKGADVINMSFGGYSRSQIEEDALATAFMQAVLVAAAGNDGRINLPCPGGRDMYPAAYNWVLGVMASTSSGTKAGFSNYDCVPRDTHEYELMAPGVDIWSTLPQGKYAAWDGTSMAAPVVSGIAALARTKWSDKDVYSSRFIMGQIAANASPVANALNSITVAPQPNVTYLEHWLFDTAAQSPSNDPDGIVDAGETVDLAITIRNHWGSANPVSVLLEPWAEGAVGPDPYITMITDTVDYGAVGSFNKDDNGLIYDGTGTITGVLHPFRFVAAPDTPNDHVIPFRLTITAGNGYAPGQPTQQFVSRFFLVVQNGVELPRIISEDMVLSRDNLWIVPDQTLIEAGVTVTVTEGAQLQFWTADPSSIYAQSGRPRLQVEGNLVVAGSETFPAEFFPGSLRADYTVNIIGVGAGRIAGSYMSIVNPVLQNITDGIDHGLVVQATPFVMQIDPNNQLPEYTKVVIGVSAIEDSIFRDVGDDYDMVDVGVNFNIIRGNLFDKSNIHFTGPPGSGADASGMHGWSNVFLKNRQPRATSPIGTFVTSDLINLGPTSPGGNTFEQNAFLNVWREPSQAGWMKFMTYAPRDLHLYFANNYWGTASTTQIDAAITDYNDNFNLGKIIYEPRLTTAPESAYPFVVDVTVNGTSGAQTPRVGAEPVTFVVTFNRDMAPDVQPAVSFGPDVPFTDFSIHAITGGWTNARTWQGTFNVNPVTGDGIQLLRVAGAVAADDAWLVTGDDSERFAFEVITSGTEAMNLQATGGEGYVDLSWSQDDFDLLAGYNLYRSTSQNGTYTRINASIIPPETREYRDTAVTPGIPYYYKFTVVKSDMSESDFSNVATGTPLDTIAPAISHTPLSSAAPGLPLSIFADVTDNVAVQSVTLFYRSSASSGAYSSRSMTLTTGNRYNATLEGSLLASPGLHYYVEASDGVSTARSGRAENPWTVSVVDKPVVTSISPVSGPAAGGTAVTVRGSNFKIGASISLGGALCASVVVVSATEITCSTSAHLPAAVDVRVTNTDSQFGVLLGGYTYTSQTASVSLPNVSGGQNDIVTVQVNAANVQGLLAAELTILFNPAIVSIDEVRTGALTSGWTFASNTPSPGRLRISLSNTSSVSGGGALAEIDLELLGAPGSSSALTLDVVSLNDGAIAVESAHGSATVEQVYSVAGNVHYWQGSYPVPNVQMLLHGERDYTGASNAVGAFSVNGARPDAYTLTPTLAGEVRDSISAFDATLVLRHSVELQTLTGNALTAADVNKNGSATAFDASYILQYAVGLISLPFPNSGRVWEFTPVSRTYAALNSNQTGQDFSAVLLGDPSGNWGTATVAAAEGGDTVVVSLQPLGADGEGAQTYAIIVDPGDAGEIFSLEALISYDGADFEALAPTAPEGWMIADNRSAPGQMRVAVASAIAISAPTELVTLRFAAKETGDDPAITVTSLAIDERYYPVVEGVWRALLPRVESR